MEQKEKHLVRDFSNIINTDSCATDIKSILQTAQNLAYRKVNSVMTQAYWLIGRRIVLQEQKGAERAEYGRALIKNLSKTLISEGFTSFSVSQLWNCRQFYSVFNDEAKLYTLCRELSWSHIRQIMRLNTAAERDFYIDLVFYNYFLKCFVLVDLKMDKLTHQDIGQMDMYVRMFDDMKRIPGDNPTIGVILCTDKEETIVKYSVLNESKQIFASKYMTYLPTEEELSSELERNRKFYLQE